MADAAMVIAVDGPGAAGKGTLARRLAEHFGLRYLDSGALYRAVAARLLRDGGDPADTGAAARAAESLTADDLSAPGLRAERVGQAASVVAAYPAVRAALLVYQRRFGEAPPGAVIDGRDIGTVVFPGTPYKLFVTARLTTRVDRRFRELAAAGGGVSRDAVEREMAARDERDRTRVTAPLAPAADAVEIDTTELDANAAFAAALAVISRLHGPL